MDRSPANITNPSIVDSDHPDGHTAFIPDHGRNPRWLMLRRQLIRSSVWLLGSSIGAGAGLSTILVTELIYHSGVIAYIVWVLIYSVVTGLPLTGLLANNDHAQASLVHAT